MTTKTAETDAFYRAAERRIEYFTLGMGVLAAVAVLLAWTWRESAGVFVGAVLGWVNYRWLKQGLAPLTRFAVAQADAPKVKVPKRVYAKFIGRYALIVGCAYVIFTYSLLPAAAVLGGLFALVAAVIVEMLYELTRS